MSASASTSSDSAGFTVLSVIGYLLCGRRNVAAFSHINALMAEKIDPSSDRLHLFVMTSTSPRISPRQGRPEATSHAEIERAAFALFEERGFDATTLEDIAKSVGVGRRTLFRYFESKNDIPWGEFDKTLDDFYAILRATAPDLSLIDALAQGVAEFNRFPATANPPHEQRMLLILETPTLQAHSAVRYASWRTVISDFVAERTQAHPDDPTPNLLGHVCLALARSAYDEWILDPQQDLPSLVAEQFARLSDALS